MAFGLETYSIKANREDLLDLLADIDPDKTPIIKPKQKENKLWKTLEQLL